MKSIAFFDSGIGGLTVLHLAQKMLSHEHLIYFADTDNVPYGTKSSAQINYLVQDAVEFLDRSYELKALVLACNTATSVSVTALRDKYSFPIVGMEPAVKPAHELYAVGKKVLVCATDLTLKLDKLNNLVDQLGVMNSTDYLSLQELVLFAENGQFYTDPVIKYLCDKLEDVDWSQYGALVLGCTHFLYYQTIIASILPAHVTIVDGNLGTIKNLKSRIKSNKDLNIPEIDFYQSSRWELQDTFSEYWSLLDEQSSQIL